MPIRAALLFVASMLALLAGLGVGGDAILILPAIACVFCIGALASGWLSGSGRDIDVSPWKQRRAERRLGEMLTAQKAGEGLAKPGVKPTSNSLVDGERIPKLADTGISYDLSSRAQADGAPGRPLPPADWFSNEPPILTTARLPVTSGSSVRAKHVPPPPDDYERHANTPGILYAARNPYHRDHLFKLGYSTCSISERLRTLNLEHSDDTHIGEFERLHDVPVPHAYNDEQYLFQVLDEFRVAQKREFFLIPPPYVVQVMNAVSACSIHGSTGAMDWPRHEPSLVADLQALRSEPVNHVWPQERAGAEGWILVLRNECHRPNVFRVAATTTDPLEYLETLNRVQRGHTSQVGFYGIVACWTANQPQAVVRSFLAGDGASYRIGRTSFVQLDMNQLQCEMERVIAKAAQGGAGGQSIEPWPAHDKPSRPERVRAPMESEPVPVPSFPSTAPHRVPSVQADLPTRPPSPATAPFNTCPYPKCFGTVYGEGSDGHVDKLRCPRCRRIVGFEVDGNRLNVWRDRF